MAGPGEIPPQDATQTQRPRGLIPPEVIDLVVPPIKVGAWCGGAGASAGIVAAIVRDASPWMSAAMTGTQWAVLGSTYWFSRLVAMRAMVGQRESTPFEKVKASAAAGVPTGLMLNLSLRSVQGNRGLASSIVVCSAAASGGQLLVNTFTGRKRKSRADPEDGHWLGGRYSPLKQLSDEEYIHMMDEKILRVDADIALIDDRIKDLQRQQQPREKPE